MKKACYNAFEVNEMKRTLSILLIMILMLSCFLCSCNEETPAETGRETEPPAAVETIDDAREIPEAEDLLGAIPSWAYRGSDGFLQSAGDYAEQSIRTTADLAPWRKFFPDLSDADAARITSDKEGACLLVEMTPSFDLSDFTTAGIDREAGNIVITILETEADVQAPAHTVFLFYFPSSLYRGETIRVLFS